MELFCACIRVCVRAYNLAVPQMTLKAARDKRRWTQEQLAAKSGIVQSQISRIERGEVEDPQNSTVEALEEALRLKRGTLKFGPEAVNA